MKKRGPYRTKGGVRRDGIVWPNRVEDDSPDDCQVIEPGVASTERVGVPTWVVREAERRVPEREYPHDADGKFALANDNDMEDMETYRQHVYFGRVRYYEYLQSDEYKAKRRERMKQRARAK